MYTSLAAPNNTNENVTKAAESMIETSQQAFDPNSSNRDPNHISVNTGHSGPIHDAAPDFYGMYLATASGDHTVKIWNTVDRLNPVLEKTLDRHQAAVMHVDWAHPRNGTLLATGGYDKRVFVWRRGRNGEWNVVHAPKEFNGPVNALQFAPTGLFLAVVSGSSCGGSCHILSRQAATGQWTEEEVQLSSKASYNAVSWAPPSKSSLLASGPIVSQNSPTESYKFAIAATDGTVRVVEFDPNDKQWKPDSQWPVKTAAEGAHQDWVWDVAWRPHIGVPTNVIASAGQDKCVIIWSKRSNTGVWTIVQKIEMGEPCYRVSWSFTGSLLAVAHGSNNVTLFQETSEDHFEKM